MVMNGAMVLILNFVPRTHPAIRSASNQATGPVALRKASAVHSARHRLTFDFQRLAPYFGESARQTESAGEAT